MVPETTRTFKVALGSAMWETPSSNEPNACSSRWWVWASQSTL